VDIYLKNRQLATHERWYGNNKWQLEPDHYLNLLKERPMAFNSARPIRQWRTKWPEALEKLHKRFCLTQGETAGTRDFISVLMFYRTYKADDIEAAVELAMENVISSSQGVLHLLIYLNEQEHAVEPLNGWGSLPPADISQYGRLGSIQ